MLHDELERDRPVPFVGVRPVDRADGRRQGVDRVEKDGRETQRCVCPRTLEDELRVLSGDAPLVGDLEYVIERGRRKALAPDLGRQCLGKLEGDFGRLEPAVRGVIRRAKGPPRRRGRRSG